MSTKTLEQNINQAISDFNAIKTAIKGKGVEVAAGTPTSEYAAKVESVFGAGQQDIVDVANPAVLAETEKLRARLDGNAGESSDIYNKVFNEGVEAGKKSEWDVFWDAYQNADVRNAGDYERAFGHGHWSDANFYPKYDIICKRSAYYLFACAKITNLKQRLLDCGVVLDTSQAINLGEAFAWSYTLTHLPEISMISLNSAASYIFSSGKIKSIDKIILREDGTNMFSTTFSGANSLESLTVEGTIGQNGFDIHWSPLNKASITSIVNALSSTTTGLTVTIRLSAVNAAFETSTGANDGSTSDEWLALAATKPNWTISLIDS